MHEYPHEYTQIWHVYDKSNTQIEEDIMIAGIPKEYTQRLYPKYTRQQSYTQKYVE